MHIKYLGHSSFLITTEAGTRILTDPFDPSEYTDLMSYNPFHEAVDIITVSHGHRDHSAIHVAHGTPVVIKGNGKFGANEVDIRGVETFHDNSFGEVKGRNTVFIISVDGLRVTHMGDLGHVLTADQAAEIGATDIALIPVGGNYTIGPAQADKVAEQVEAKIVVPMHYRTEKCWFPITGVESYIDGKTNVTVMPGSVLDVTPESLPHERQIVVLKHSL
ncbi:MBL fold metallo-hydrolase [bacterium]|nr:MBL fold metallo-hydrolase [bacterium]